MWSRLRLSSEVKNIAASQDSGSGDEGGATGADGEPLREQVYLKILIIYNLS